MGLRTALVDRAYLRGKHADTRVVQGRRIYKPGESAPIRARLTMQKNTERRDGARTVVERRPQLLLDLRDADGKPVVLTSSMKLRVVSKELGEALWQVDGEPEPLRKKRRLIGWEANLVRLEENENPRA